MSSTKPIDPFASSSNVGVAEKSASPRVVDFTAPTDGPTKPAEWDGVHTKFRLAYGQLRNGEFVHAGETVTFAASFDGERWRGPEASTVAHQLATGNFAGTIAYTQRKQAQGAIDYERGVNRTDGEPGPEGLEERTSEQQYENLEDMLRGGAAEMRRKEAQESRTAADEKAEKLEGVITSAFEKLAAKEN